MPIYEFACPKCRRIFSFLSKRVNPSHSPACPKCGRKNLTKEISRFAALKGVAQPASAGDEQSHDEPAGPDLDDPRVAQVMSELESDMEHLDESNPKHMAHLIKKMKTVMPEGAIPKEFDIAIKRLEAGEDPEKIEADMGDVLGDFLGDPSGEEGGPPRGPGYSRDEGLYDY